MPKQRPSGTGMRGKTSKSHSWPYSNLKGGVSQERKITKLMKGQMKNKELLNLSFSPMDKELLKGIMEGRTFQSELLSLFNSVCLKPLPFKPTTEPWFCL